MKRCRDYLFMLDNKRALLKAEVDLAVTLTSWHSSRNDAEGMQNFITVAQEKIEETREVLSNMEKLVSIQDEAKWSEERILSLKENRDHLEHSGLDESAKELGKSIEDEKANLKQLYLNVGFVIKSGDI